MAITEGWGYKVDQLFELVMARQMPAAGADTANRGCGFKGRITLLVISTIRIVHGNFPSVQAAVLGAICTFIIIAAAPCVAAHTGDFIRIRVVVQVLRHPGLAVLVLLVADYDGLVYLAIAKICKGICGSIVFAAVLDARTAFYR